MHESNIYVIYDCYMRWIFRCDVDWIGIWLNIGYGVMHENYVEYYLCPVALRWNQGMKRAGSALCGQGFALEARREEKPAWWSTLEIDESRLKRRRRNKDHAGSVKCWGSQRRTRKQNREQETRSRWRLMFCAGSAPEEKQGGMRLRWKRNCRTPAWKAKWWSTLGAQKRERQRGERVEIKRQMRWRLVNHAWSVEEENEEGNMCAGSAEEKIQRRRTRTCNTLEAWMMDYPAWFAELEDR